MSRRTLVFLALVVMVALFFWFDPPTPNMPGTLAQGRYETLFVVVAAFAGSWLMDEWKSRY